MVLDSYQEVCTLPEYLPSKNDLKQGKIIVKDGVISSLPALLSQVFALEESQAYANFSKQICELVLDHSIVYEIGYPSHLFTQILVDQLKSSGKSVQYYSVANPVSSPKSSTSNPIENVTVHGYPMRYEDSIKGQIEYALQENTSSPKTIFLAGGLVNILTQHELHQLLKYLNQNLNIGDRLITGVGLSREDEFPCSKDELIKVLRGHLPNSKGEANITLETKKASKNYFIQVNVNSDGELNSAQEGLNQNNLTFSDSINVFNSYNDFNEIISSCEFCPGPNFFSNNEDSKYIITSFYKPEFYFLPKHLGPNKPTPGLSSWNQLFKAWDYVTRKMITPDMRLEQPISLRHPFIFYFGHIPAFLDIQISRHFQQPYTEPSYFVQIFERGIDPDVDDPTKCHDHSAVPNAWPKFEEIVEYDQRVRERLSYILQNEPLSARLGRVLFMAFEHQAMHLETLMYMLMQSDNFAPVSKQLTIFDESEQLPLDPSPWIRVEGGDVKLGHDDDETEDHHKGYFDIREYGWDNETPSRSVNVKPFMIQSRPVTNMDYLEFIKSNPNHPIPALWIPTLENPFGYNVRSFYGPLPFDQCLNWPAQISYRDAQFYFEWKGDGSRLPTEEELILCDQNYDKLNAQLNRDQRHLSHRHRENVGFVYWSPTPATNDRFDLFNSQWEWTGSFLAPYPGYHPSELYPGYSYDFHDEKHLVVLGGSYLSHPWFAKRGTFRNWFHEGYPYAFIGFRGAKDI